MSRYHAAARCDECYIDGMRAAAAHVDRYRRALEYIANTNPNKRPDGTYSVSREALIEHAKRALGES